VDPQPPIAGPFEPPRPAASTNNACNAAIAAAQLSACECRRSAGGPHARRCVVVGRMWLPSLARMRVATLSSVRLVVMVLWVRRAIVTDK